MSQLVWFKQVLQKLNRNFSESAKSTNTSTKSEPAATAATTTTKSKEKSDLVYLTLILVDSGKSHEFRISPKVRLSSSKLSLLVYSAILSFLNNA